MVPFGKALLHRFKEAAAAELPPGAFVSTDDLLTARVWRALRSLAHSRAVCAAPCRCGGAVAWARGRCR